AGAGAHVDRGLIVHHLLALARHHKDDLLGARMIVALVAFSRRQHNHPEAETLGPGDRRLAQNLDAAPVEGDRLDLVAIRNPSSTRLLHRKPLPYFRDWRLEIGD